MYWPNSLAWITDADWFYARNKKNIIYNNIKQDKEHLQMGYVHTIRKCHVLWNDGVNIKVVIIF